MIQIRKHVCAILYKPTETIQNENVALHELLVQTFKLISSIYPETEGNENKERAGLVFKFILKLSCDPIHEKYKHMANYDSRIFNFDKPNKYKEEVKLMRAIQSSNDLIPFRKQFALEVKYRLFADLQ